MAVTADRGLLVTPCTLGGAVAGAVAVEPAVVALFGRFYDAVAADGGVRVAAVFNPGAVRVAAGAGGAVEYAVVALFWELGDAITASTFDPSAVGATAVTRFTVVGGAMVTLLSWLQNAIAALVFTGDEGAVGRARIAGCAVKNVAVVTFFASCIVDDVVSAIATELAVFITAAVVNTIRQASITFFAIFDLPITTDRKTFAVGAAPTASYAIQHATIARLADSCVDMTIAAK